MVGIDPDGLRSLAAAGRSGSTGLDTVRQGVATIALDGFLDDPAAGSLALLVEALAGLAGLCEARIEELETIVPWGLDEQPSTEAMLDFVDDGSGTGALVFSLFDGANQGDLDEADGNWSTDDVLAARDPERVRQMLEEQAAEDGVELDPIYVDTVVAMTTGIAQRLDVDEEDWEGVDDDVGWYETGVVGWVGDNWTAAVPPQIQAGAEAARRLATEGAEAYLEWAWAQANADGDTFSDRLTRAEMTMVCGFSISPFNGQPGAGSLLALAKITQIMSGDHHGGLEDCAWQGALLD